MILPLFIAAIAAISAAQCQEITETVTRCTTSYSEFPVPTGSTIETLSTYATITNNMTITTTTQQTITVTPAATTFTDVVNATTTVTTTVTSVPAATTMPAPVGFFPLINAPAATPTAFIGRHRRATIDTRAQHLEKVKRLPKTPKGNTGGFIVLANGHGQSLNRIYPWQVTCRYTVNINSTTTVVVTALPQTETLVPATATAVSTSTTTATETIIEIEAQPTEYAACQPNNVGK